MRILHCSDVHVTCDYGSVPFLSLGWRRWIALLELTVGGRSRQYAHAEEVLGQIVRDFGRLAVDHFVLSGDLTAYAMEAEFTGAWEQLKEVAQDPRRCTIIPGNHDVYTPRAFRGRRFERFFGHLLVSDLPEYCKEGAFPMVRLLGEEAAVVGLRSARVPPAPGLSFGWVGRAQLQALEQLIADPRLAGRAVLVVVHHAPLRRSGKRDRLTHGLLDTSALLELLPGPRFAVLHGHVHSRYHHPATSDRPHLFGAGSSTQAGNEGYWLVEVGQGRVLGGELKRPGVGKKGQASSGSPV